MSACRQVIFLAWLRTQALLGLIQLNTKKLKDGFLPVPAKCLDDIEQLLPVLGQQKVAVLLEEINLGNAALAKGAKLGWKGYTKRYTRTYTNELISLILVLSLYIVISTICIYINPWT